MQQNVSIDRAHVTKRLVSEERRLERIRTALEQESTLEDADRDPTSDAAGSDQHPADVGSELFERERAISILQRVEAKLADVRRALRHLESGEYGICEACGRPISPARLEARPAARFCLEDQARAEREARAS